MFCNKCGNEIKNNQQYCNKCGNRINYDRQTNHNENSYYVTNDSTNYNRTDKSNGKKINILIPIVSVAGLIVILVFGMVCYIICNNWKNNYFFDNEKPITQSKQTPNNQNNSPINNQSSRKYRTDIIADNTYSGITVNSVTDAKQLIEQDSVNQKQEDYPKEIIQIENTIIQEYGITAVNLKEVDLEFAKELEDVLKDLYNEYPNAREHLTNLTLINLPITEGNTIALFRPVFTFGTSNTNTTRPWVIKTQIQLNAKYFLNPDKLQMAAETSSKAGHFPKNATRYSSIAHEFGHYLSFIALMNHHSTDSILLLDDNKAQNLQDIYMDFGQMTFSRQMLEEAYQNYLSNNGQNIGFDEWRGQISQYALQKDESGNYIYDETIAEAFHDVYLNKENASTPSKYIVEVLKKYVGR